MLYANDQTSHYSQPRSKRKRDIAPSLNGGMGYIQKERRNLIKGSHLGEKLPQSIPGVEAGTTKLSLKDMEQPAEL